ncbi:MAG: 4a-hydroxytetrahydrobiopterin dehydratase [Burkholderiales bacterium]|jgi:4a-hydroxytetrahydrobiopterin dehydratase|nr:4a-hydroxytetrahydrobiopterin dehydratase [Burkholderiales bacterium]
MTPLAARRCRHQTEATPLAEALTHLAELPGWEIGEKALVKTFAFADYHQTIAFVNAVAWIAHREDHHPDLGVTYNRCRVEWSTHSVGGLSENDLICAAKVEALVRD